MSYLPKQRVRVRRLVGPMFEPDWQERGTVLKPRAINLPLPGPDWHLVRVDGGTVAMCIHASSLMADNAAAA